MTNHDYLSLRGRSPWQSQQMNKQYYVYILTNKSNSVLYIGVTNDLKRRVFEHKEKLVPGFTKKYNVDKLVHFEFGEDIIGAITREKKLKDGPRSRKIKLIEHSNPEWRDLFDDL
ncbi:MAG: GIY-YIG nuclease family protein [Dehalococcoidales bacterium]|nr:GIY-YIG nuclease family protein [Dehalococcoidales bacterium]